MRIALDDRYREASASRFPDHQVSYFSAVATDAAGFLERVRDADVVACWQPGRFPFGRDLIDSLPNLQYVHKSGVGADWFDVAALNEHGILLSVNPGVNAGSVAEHALMLMLLCLRSALGPIVSMRDGVWTEKQPERRVFELAGKTVGIVGMGGIGSHFARRLTGFGVDILAYRRRHLPELAILTGLKWSSLDDLLQASDVVVLCLPLTPETEKLIGARELGLMKPTAVLVNVARGRVVDERALYEALAERRILAAGLDTLEQEPTPPDNPLPKLPNVVVTPHLGGPSEEGWKRQRQLTMENIELFLVGKPPLRLVNPEVLERGNARAKHLNKSI